MCGADVLVYNVVGGGELHAAHIGFVYHYEQWRTVYSHICGIILSVPQCPINLISTGQRGRPRRRAVVGSFLSYELISPDQAKVWSNHQDTQSCFWTKTCITHHDGAEDCRTRLPRLPCTTCSVGGARPNHHTVNRPVWPEDAFDVDEGTRDDDSRPLISSCIRCTTNC